jgi:hypothetical protein
VGAVTLGRVGAVRATGIGAITSGGTGTTLVVTARRWIGAGTGQLTSAVSGTMSMATTATTWNEIDTGQKDHRMALPFRRCRDAIESRPPRSLPRCVAPFATHAKQEHRRLSRHVPTVHARFDTS